MNNAAILIVEDESIVAEDLANKLRQLSYAVAGITSEGEEAVALTGRLHPALVLMDISLDGPMDGIEAAEAIRRQHDVPVIYLTAHSDPATLARAKLTGPFGYILKPFDERELATQIELARYKHQTDRQLRQEREWLRVTLRSIGDAVIATDAEGQVTFLNPVAELLTGWKAEEAAGRPVACVFRIVNEQTGQAAEEPVARVLREGRAVELTNHSALVTKDGRTVPIEDSAAPIMDAAGQVIGVVLVFHDVTEKRRAEEALRESDEIARRRLEEIEELYHHAPVGLCVLDKDLRWVRINDHLAKINGFPAAAHIGKRVRDLLPHLADLVEPGMKKVLEGEPQLNIEIPDDITESGVSRTWLASWLPLRGRDGKVFGINVVAEDITNRKRIEDTLRLLARGDAQDTNGEFFQEVARYLAGTLGMDFVCIDRLEDDLLAARTLAVFHNGRFEDNVSYTLKDTPCGDVVGKAVCCFPKGVRTLFPKDAVLQEMQAESYLGTTLWNREGRPIGLIAVIGRQPLTDIRMAESILQLVGVRAAGELERQQAEAALRESEQRIQMALEVSRSFAFEWEPSTDQVSRSDSCGPVLGVSGDELRHDTGQTYFQRVHPEDRDRFVRMLADLNPSADTYRTEYRLIRGDGTTAVLEESARGFFDKDGRLCRVVGVGTDITERKRAEAAVRESEARYRSLFEHMLDGLAYCQMLFDEHDHPQDFIYLAVNESFGRLTGLEDVIGKKVTQIIPQIKELNPELFEIYGRVALTGSPERFEIDFKPLGLYLAVSVYSPGKGYFVAVFDDITERKHAEDELAQAKQRLEMAQEAGRIGTFVMDVAQKDSVLITGMATVYGDVPENVTGQYESWRRRVHPDDIDRVEQLVADALAGRAEYDTEYRILWPDGSIHWVGARGEVQRDDQGRPLRLIGVNIDITDRKRAEEALRESEARFRLALRNAPVSVAAQDRELRYIWAYNQRTARPEEIIGRLDSDIFMPEEAAHITAIKRRVLDENVELREQMWLDRPSGRIFLDICWEPIRDEAGRVTGVASATVDLTPIKFAEEESRRSAAALSESEERLRLLGDNLPDSAVYQYIHETNGSVRFLYFSAGIERLCGVSVADVLRDAGTLHRQSPPEYIERLVEAEARSKRELSDFDMELPMHRPDGEVRWMRLHSRPRRLSDGRTIWDGVQIDITARKQAEAEIAKLNQDLQRRVAELQTIFETAPIGLSIADDPLGHHIRGNPANERVLGVGAGGELSKAGPRAANYRCLQEGQELAVAELPMQRAVRGESVTGQVFDVVREDGQTITLYSSASPLFDETGVPRGAVGAFLDITPLKRGEERARLLSEIRAQLLASDQPQQIVEALCRRVMDHLGCQVFFNFLLDEHKNHLRLNACAGIPEEAAHQIESLDFGVAVCGCVARDGRRIVAEHIRTTPDPRTDLVRSFGIQAYACHPLMNQGQTIGTLSFGSRLKSTFTEDELGLMKAVTDHVAIAMQRIRLLESLERHAQAAEAANEAKSQFLTNMSHELRTPMNAILGMIDVALPKAVDPTVQDCLQTAKGSADLLLTLLNDLLDSAKIESGKLELESAPFSLRRMLDQITRVLSVRASEKGLCFYCRMPDETPDAVVGDRMRLQQVLLNLASNAIKFTERGDVEISLHALSQDGETCLEFAVRDTGIGIPASGLDRLFQPFTQADASMARRFGGTGLGLAICKSLVELMGGRIWVESKLGVGSTFYFTIRLPLAKELPADYEAPVTVPAVACVQLRVLLVEDNPANQKLANYILQDRGHLVEIAGDGQEALCLTEQNRYDVILMDVQMPGMNGLEATAAIRKRESSGSRVPIIAMTAHAMRGDRDRCLAAGMDGYLSKPVNAREMIGLVESLARDVLPVTRFAPVVSCPAETSPLATAFAFNADEALGRCFNSRDMVREMIQCFFDDVDNLFPQMRAALERGDLVEVGRLGHRMKGTVVYLGAHPAKEAALRVERFCKSSGGTPSEAEEAINALEHECIALRAALCKHPLAADSTQGD